MLSKKMEEALNAQVNAEFWSAYLYLSMSNHFAAAGNQGFANWFSITSSCYYIYEICALVWW